MRRTRRKSWSPANIISDIAKRTKGKIINEGISFQVITVYSQDGCPKCKVLKMKLDQKGLSYNECKDVELMMALGFMALPVMAVDEQVMPFEAAVKYVDAQ